MPEALSERKIVIWNDINTSCYSLMPDHVPGRDRAVKMSAFRQHLGTVAGAEGSGRQPWE